jgi:prephenate dehydrogenase
VFPKNVMIENLSSEIDIIATHPLFGPDSLKDSGSVMTMESVRDLHGRFEFWKNYFNSQNITIEEISAEEHDMMAARSQGLTHFIGRVIDDFGTDQTRIDTEGYKALHKLVNQTCNDSWELFEDIQSYNPYTQKMVSELSESFKKINEILKK